MSGALPIRLAPYAAIADSQMLHIVPAARYASVPPGLTGFVPGDAVRAQALLRLWARQEVACPAEAVMLYRDAIVLDGKQVLGPGGTGVAESFHADVGPHRAAWQQAHLDRIAAGEVGQVPADGAPVAAVFGECGFNLGHVMVEVLPRLVLLHDAGVRRLRLLVPEEARPFWPLAALALEALGMQGEALFCPEGQALRVAALLWVSPVARHEHRKSPTLRRLLEWLRAVAGTGGPERVYVARPDGARRPITNAAAVEAAVRAAGYAVVEPAALPMAGQLALFAGARRMLGPMGAALSWMAAMAPGGHVAMLEGGNCDGFFWDLACLCGHRFTWGFTAPVTAYEPAMLSRAMTVDMDLLAELLAVLEAG